MRNVVWLFIVLGMWCVPSPARAADSTPADERVTLDMALRLSGLSSLNLPVVLTPVLADTASTGADAWTVYDDSGNGQRIFVYTRGRTFQCASIRNDAQYQCMLRLASIIVHEAWHLNHGPDEATAYGAQLMFLESNGASNLHMLDIRRSRNRVLADRRKAR